jgi:pyrophosphatase PpaX
MSTFDVAGRKRRYDAILFDLDGVLADTREWVVSAFYEIAERHSLEISDEILNHVFGRSIEECYELIGAGHDQEFLVEAHRAFQREHMDLIKPFPGTQDVLESLTSAGLKMGIVTGRRHMSALDTLERLGLSTYFSVLVGGDDTERQKPNPDPALRVLSLLGASPASALMVGDARSDMLCGKAAGCDTCAALYGFVGPHLLNENPTYSIGNITELLPIVLELTA